MIDFFQTCNNYKGIEGKKRFGSKLTFNKSIIRQVFVVAKILQSNSMQHHGVSYSGEVREPMFLFELFALHFFFKVS